MSATSQSPRTRMPADINAEDKVIYGLSFRQLAILAIAAAVMYGGWQALQHILPATVLVPAGVLGGGAAFALAAGRRDGLPLDQWLLHGLRFSRTPKALSATATAGGELPEWVDPPAVKPVMPAPLRFPAHAIDADGTIRLNGGDAAVVATTGINLGLRTEPEQAAAVDTFGRWLNSLNSPVQIVVSAQPVDLAAHAAALHDAATEMPHRALRQACADHAAFLADLATRRDPLRRQILLVNRTGSGGEHAARRQADDTARALAGLGVSTKALDGPAVTAAIVAAADPYRQARSGGIAAPGTVITSRSERPLQ